MATLGWLRRHQKEPIGRQRVGGLWANSLGREAANAGRPPVACRASMATDSL